VPGAIISLMSGTLYLVATPIGNLEDITLRAIEVLRSVDLIACEDTRHTRKLLNHYEIKKDLISYHEHNEHERAAELIELIQGGKSVAIVSDAGTPGISDPSYRVVVEATQAGIEVVPIPGAAAFVSAATVSGLPTDSILFAGFLPSKKSERVRRLEQLADVPATLVFYEAPHRLLRSLEDCIEHLGNRLAAVAKELTKVHENVVRGTLTDIHSYFLQNEPRGEFVLVIDRRSEKTLDSPKPFQSISMRLQELLQGGLDRKTALKAVAKEFGLSKSEAYRRLEIEKNR
jgi:16S rRNA (cytidine1402-2'-O)-methyltransferase